MCEPEEIMKVRFLTFGLLLLLGACGIKCPPITAPSIPVETKLKEYRLSGLIVEAAAQPSAEGATIVGDDDENGDSRGALLHVTAKMLRSAFKQAGEKGYDTAPAVQVLCRVDALKAGSVKFYITSPAQFAATLTLVDPATGAAIYTNHYSRNRNAEAVDCDTACINKSIGRNAFQNAVRDVAVRFGNDAPSARKLAQGPLEAAIDGTLVYTDGVLSLTTANLETILKNARDDGENTRAMTRIAENVVPNILQRRIDKAKLFSNSPKTTYRIASYVTKFYYNRATMFSSGNIQYTADTVIFRNDKEIGHVVFVSKEVPLSREDGEFARQADELVAYIKNNVEKLMKKEVTDEKVSLHACGDVYPRRLRYDQ